MIEKIKADALKNKIPIIKDDSLIFIVNIIKNNNVKEILELGTAVAYSAISFAMIDDSIHVDTIEKDENMYNEAENNVTNMNMISRISIFKMPIEDFKISKKYDLIFVDAAKAQYGKYLEMFIDNLKDDGIMIFDNMIFHNMIYDIESIESKNLRNLVKKIINFRENIKNDNRFDIIFYDSIGDGLLLLKKKREI